MTDEPQPAEKELVIALKPKQLALLAAVLVVLILLRRRCRVS